jgi:glutamate--cysteine ligase catalytic subunit
MENTIVEFYKLSDKPSSGQSVIMDTSTQSTLLDYTETKKYAARIKLQGILYVIEQYKKYKDRQDDPTLWGDELEYMLLHVNHTENTARLLLKHRVLQNLQNNVPHSLNIDDYGMTWQPESGIFQLESTPGKPFGPDIKHIGLMEENMKMRRQQVIKILEDKERLLCISIYPRTGTPNYTFPDYKPTPKEGLTRSLFVPDETYTYKPRYRYVILLVFNFSCPGNDNILPEIILNTVQAPG